MAIAEAIKNAYDDVDVSINKDRIRVSFKHGLNITLCDVGTDVIVYEEQWRNLMKEIKRTLVGAKIREFNNALIGISPLRERRTSVRLSHEEMRLVRKAAEMCYTSITDFARTAVLKKADEVFNKETLRRMEERAEKDRKTPPYIG